MEYYFRAEKMSVGYHNKPLIENININLKKGEILTLIGPNGAGKSTILKSIAHQLSLIHGTVYLDEECVDKMSGTQLAKNMAVVLTQKLRTEMMTCEDVVATGRHPYTGQFGILSKKDYQVVNDAMEMVNVSYIKDEDFTKISDGQRQRVMLARAICQEPQIIILDEPTSYLDVKYKLEFLSILQKMRSKKGLTVIMSLHELDLAQRVSDKILCINGKYVERLGCPEEIFKGGYISELFDISAGSFDDKNSSMELSSIKGDADIFVIAGGGTGRDVYRRLQRGGIPFITGIIYENDLDYPVAKALATDIIKADSFEPVSNEQFELAKRRIYECGKVICCKETFGTYDNANKLLLDYAEKCGKSIEIIKERPDKKYVKSNNGTGDYVKCGKKHSGSRIMQDI